MALKQSLKVLFADDSITAQNMAKTILGEAGYEVTVVSNGAAAYKKIQESAPDVLILDIFMPGYSGLEICEKIRAERATASIPVLLTVGKMEPYRPEDGARVQADGVIVKPFEASDLLAVMQQFESKIEAARARSAPKPASAPRPPADQSQWSMSPVEETVPEEMPVAPAMEMSREEASAPAFGDFFGESETAASSNFSTTPERQAPTSAASDFTSAPETIPGDEGSGFFTSEAGNVHAPAGQSPAAFAGFEENQFTPEYPAAPDKKSESFASEVAGAAAGAAAVAATAAAASTPRPPHPESAAAAPQPGPNDTQPICTNFSDAETQKVSGKAVAATPAAAPDSSKAAHLHAAPEAPAGSKAGPPQAAMTDAWDSPFETPQAKPAAPPAPDPLQGWEAVSVAPPVSKAWPAPPKTSAPPPAPPEARSKPAAASDAPSAKQASAAPAQPGERHEEDILDIGAAAPAAASSSTPASQVPTTAAAPPADTPAAAAPPPATKHGTAPAQRPKFASLPMDSAVDIEPEPELDEDDILEAQPPSRVHGFAAAAADPDAVQQRIQAELEHDDILGEPAKIEAPSGADPALITDPLEMSNAFPTRFGLDNPEPVVVGMAADAPAMYTEPAPEANAGQQDQAASHADFDDDILAAGDEPQTPSPASPAEQIHLIQNAHPAAAATAPEASATAASEAPATAEHLNEETVARLVQNVMDQLRPNLVAEITRQLKEQKPGV